VTNTNALVSAGQYGQAVPVALGGTGKRFVIATPLQPRTIGATLGVKF
jgi:hypothetical protein